ncbi:hypothetical protein AHF37_02849 [Paragonimus kellicotti]|nr:hypothetical protein AHF37_02849 [Paragonimus kellicotti]
MFLKTNLFKQFRKDVCSFDSSEFHNAGGRLNKSRESILWGGIDDTENNSGCDLDEEDDYFHGNSFMGSTSGGSEDSFDESKWSNFPSYLEVSKKFSRHESGNRNRLLNIRKNNTHLSEKEVHSTVTKEHTPENPKSPSPSRCNNNETAASPMLNFLKRKNIVDQIQSPDNRINSSTDNTLSPYNQRSALKDDMSEVSNSPTMVGRTDTTVDENSTAIVDQGVNNYPENNKLKMLYKTLRQETSKFIKWKAYAGLQLEEKDGDLRRADAVIENLRKSNLELQMNLESVSLKYNNELENRTKVKKEMDNLVELVQSLLVKFEVIVTAKDQVCERTDKANADICTLTKMYENIQRDLSHHSNICSAKMKSLQNYISQLSQLNETLQLESKTSLERLQNLDEQFHLEKSQLEGEILRLLREIDHLSTENVELLTTVKDLSIQCKFCESLLAKKENYIAVLEDAKLALFDQLTMSRNEITSKTKQIEEKEMILQEQNDQLFNERKRNENKEILNRSLQQRNAAITEELEKLKCFVEDSEKQQSLRENSIQGILNNTLTNIQCLFSFSSEKKELLMGCNLCLSNYQDEFLLQKEMLIFDEETMKNQMNEVIKLRQQIGCLTREIEQQETKIKSGELARQNLQEKTLKLQRELSTVQRELEQKDAELKSLQNNSTILSSEIEKKEKLLQEAKSKTKDVLNELDARQQVIKEKEKEHVHMNSRINSLEKALESGNLKTSQLCQNITDLTLQLEYARQELSSQKIKEKNLQDQLTKKGAEINELMRTNEKMMKDITEKHEKVQEKLANDLSEKADEIRALRKALESKRNDCSVGAKKAEKKLNDTVGQIEKLKNQVKELTLEKRESTKKLAVQEQQISELSNKLTATTEEYESQKERQHATLATLQKLKEEVEEFRIKDAVSEREIARLSAIEKEYSDFKHQVLENSPPMSTQLPAEIATIVTQTPKSPALSVRLKNLTPQKTPRSILKQPGSASKRRRVFFAAESKENQISDVLSDSEKENGAESKEPVLTSPLSFTNTPNFHTAKIQSLEKTSNIRKTPGRKGPKFTDLNTITGSVKKLGDNWFDSDQLFGLGIED